VSVPSPAIHPSPRPIGSPVPLHRPDIPSLAFGLLFIGVAAVALVRPAAATGIGLPGWIALLAITAGLSAVGSLLVGDSRRPIGRRSVGAHAVDTGPTLAEAEDHLAALLADPLFAPPIDPDDLDRQYRETFGEDDDGDVGGRATGR
jgi:hypothetical protein